MEYVPQSPAPVQPAHSFVDRVVGSIKLSRPIFDEVRRDPGAMLQAAGVVVATGLLTGISQFASIRGQTIDLDDRNYEIADSFLVPLLGGVVLAFFALISWVVTALLFRFVAVKMFGSPETNIQWQEVARPLGFASAPGFLMLLTPIPIIGFIAGSIVGFWSLAAQIVAMSETFQVSKWRSFFIMLVAGILFGVVVGLLFCICIFAAAMFV